MKALFIVLAAVASLSAAVLSSVRVDPVYACPSTNNIFFTAPSFVTPNGQGEFEYDITVQGWDLTFNPIALSLAFDMDHCYGVQSLQIIPDGQWVSGLGCDYDDPTPFVAEVSGDLLESHEEELGGNIWVNITLLAQGANPHYTETAATLIDPIP